MIAAPAPIAAGPRMVQALGLLEATFKEWYGSTGASRRLLAAGQPVLPPTLVSLAEPVQ